MITGNVEAFNLLLSAGADPYIQSLECQTALYIAASRGNVEIINILLSNGFDIMFANDYGETALHYAVSNSNIAVFNALLSAGSDPMLSDGGGETVLHHAASAGNVEVVNLLLSLGVDLFGCTALHNAAYSGNVEFVNVLLSAGSDLMLLDENGETALDIAIKIRPYSSKDQLIRLDKIIDRLTNAEKQLQNNHNEQVPIEVDEPDDDNQHLDNEVYHSISQASANSVIQEQDEMEVYNLNILMLHLLP